MSFTVQHLRSGEEDKRPHPRDLSTGQLAINYNAASPGLFFRTLSGELIKTGPSAIGNRPPALKNWTNYSKGEFWVDSSGVDYKLNVWTGNRWQNITNFSEATSSLFPDTSCSYSLGSQLKRWNYLFLCDMDLTNEGIIPSQDRKLSLGTSKYRFTDVFTGDLHLSNKGDGNEVDGTWGSYRIQEGESDLFLINDRSGKRYKFVLEEVS
jgi:hypothetical protein